MEHGNVRATEAYSDGAYIGKHTSPGSGYYAASKAALESLSDGLSSETAPLGKVMAVEPGAFRTDFAGRSLTQSGTVIADYEQTAGQRRIGKDKTHGAQPGEPEKGARLIIAAIEKEEPPFHLLLGSDAVKFADEVMESRSGLCVCLYSWEFLSWCGDSLCLLQCKWCKRGRDTGWPD